MYTLTHPQRDGENHYVPLESLPFTIGRRRDNDLALDNPHISRYHAKIETDGQEYFLKDSGSTHGTFINGIELKAGLNQLNPGDRISLGKYPDNEDLFFDVDIGNRPTEDGLTEPLVETDSPITQQIKLHEDEREFEVLGKLIEPPLSFKRHEVLALLLKSYPAACTRDEICKAGWPDRSGDVGNGEIHTCIYNIKNRLEENGLERNILQKVSGYGYKPRGSSSNDTRS